MSTKQLITREDDSSYSQDTESLLSSEDSFEKPTLTSTSTPSRRNRSLKTCLHIAAIIFYSILTVVLYSWSIRIRRDGCDCHVGEVYSPAKSAVEYERYTIVHEVEGDSKYRGPPRPELDDAWDELLAYNMIRLPQEDLDKANVTSVPLNDKEGGYLASLDVFHTLHCVNKVRQFYYSDYYHDPNPLPDQHEHFDHCIDLLRQTIMCHGDISLHTYQWIDDYRAPWPSTETTHQCRNWDKIVSWAKDRSVESLLGPILQHPTMGISYTGDEPGLGTGETESEDGKEEKDSKDLTEH